MTTTTHSPPFIGDPFAELGVPATASHDEVRRAFRRRARETHPDHCPDDPGAAQRFARLRAAYEEALERIKHGNRHGSGRSHGPRVEGDHARRGRSITEHELAMRAQELRDPLAIRRLFARHGHRPIIGAALARNPAFPTDALEALRRVTDNHWTVEADIAGRSDVPPDMMIDIARQARETVIGSNIARNERSTSETLDALVFGPIRLETPLENVLAMHPDLSAGAAARLAGRHATNAGAVMRLIERNDLPAELLYRLAGQSARPSIASAARRDLQRRGLPAPPIRDAQRAPKTLTGYWR